jgi:hypothetical protein
MYCRWGSNYQEDGDPINQYSPASFWCLSQVRTWISNAISRGVFMFLLSVFNTLRWEVIVCFCYLYSIRWDERWLFVFVICVQYVEMGGDCLFCWYWCNCWPSTFDISYHNIRSCCKYMILLIFSGYINLLVRFCFYNETAFSNSIIFFGKLSFIF